MRMHQILAARRLNLAVTGLFVLIGVLAYLTMPRQEDPFFPYRGGVIKTIFPGADAERIRKLVVAHLEREISEIADLDFVRSTVRNNVALTTVVMKDHIYDTETKWNEVRRAIDRARVFFPPGVQEPELDDRVITTSTATYAVTGSEDLHEMAAAARSLRDAFLQLGDLVRIDIYGEPGEQVNIALEDATAERYGLSAQTLAQQLSGRVQLLGAGSLVAGSTRMTLKPETEFRSIEELRQTPVRLPSGDVLPLGALTEVWMGPQQPSTPRMWHNGESAVLVDVIAAQNTINAVAYGERMRALVDQLRPQLEPLQVQEMFYQPGRVKDRLDGLSQSLLLAVGIILLVLVLSMGVRLALLVAVILPAVAAMSLAFYALGGGVLHQMAVVGLIVALGILVDNAIVMIEEVQYQLNQGYPPVDAALNAVHQLAKPLLAATGTTIAAFIPLAVSKSGVGDFTRAVPIMIMISLVASYFFATVVTPMLGETFLKPQGKAGEVEAGWPEKLGRLAGSLGSQHAGQVLVVAGIGCAVLMAWGLSNLESEFFPQADRDQVLVDIALSEGTTLAETERVARVVERALRSYDDVLEVHGFLGHSGPRFYYNLLRRPDQPNRARLVVRSTGIDGNMRIIAAIREFSHRALPEADVIAKILAQGPPIDSPIEVRVYNEDPVHLAQATDMILQAVQNTAGAIDATHNLGLGAPEMQFEIDDAHAMSYGLSRADVAQALLSRSQGIRIGSYRATHEPAPILVRSLAGENTSPADLEGVMVFNAQGQGVPLGALAKPSLSWQPGAIYTENQRRNALVSAELDFGYVFSQVLHAVQPRLAALDLPEGTSYEFAGEAEASGDANSAIAGVAPLGLAMLLFFLLWQFNSFRRLLIVMTSVPLAFVGVIAGLALLGIPFGFQPLLGCIALIGIVVNNAIVMIDVLDQNLAAGKPFARAMTEAVERRTRPILLTTATTVAGLLPLALSNSTMWPPMAWPIITGLLTSTALTLFVVPALCRLMLAWRGGEVTPTAAAVLAGAVVALAAWQPGNAYAQESELASLMRQAQSLPVVQAQEHAARAAQALVSLERRAAWAPTLELTYSGVHRDTISEIQTGNGALRMGEHFSQRQALTVRQPLFQPSRSLYQVPAAKNDAEAQRLLAKRAADSAALGAARLYLAQLKLGASARAYQALYASYAARLNYVQSLVEQGRALNADALDVRLARDEVAQRQAELRHQRAMVAEELASIGGGAAEDWLDLREPAMVVATPAQDQALAQAEQNRPELQALARRVEGLQLRARGVKAEGWPSIGAEFSALRTDGDPIEPERDLRAAVQVQWHVFSGGTRSARHAALTAQAAELESQLAEQRRQMRLEIERAYQDLSLAQERQRLAQAAEESAKQRLAVRNSRFEAGRERIEDVLAAEAVLQQQITRVVAARWDVLQAKLDVRHALGLLSDDPTE